MSKTLLGLLLLTLATAAIAADIQIRTSDGQTLQGEHLGTKDGIVKLRTSYGVISVPEKSIVTLTAVRLPSEKPKPEPGDDPATPAPAETPASFPTLKAPNITSLMAQRLADVKQPELRKDDRQELHRAVRNFADSSDSSRNKIIRQLKSFGAAAEPFIDAAYNEPGDIYEKVDLLQAIAVPGRVLTTPLFQHARDSAVIHMDNIANEPPALPPDYLSKRDRENPQGKAEHLKIAAGFILKIEGYASTAGGPFNAMYLWEIYKNRYTSEKEDPLLVNLSRDKARLAATATDAQKSKSGWTTADRIVVAEQLFPHLFKDKEELKALATELLKKILPSGYPKWDAPENEWVEWWEKEKAKEPRTK